MSPGCTRVHFRPRQYIGNCAENGVPEGANRNAPPKRELSVTPFEVCLKMLTSFATECIVSLLLHRLA